MPDKSLVRFAANLRDLRAAAGLTQEQLGLDSGIGGSNISRYEAAQRDPSVTTVARLARSLDASVTELLEGIDR